MLSIDLIKGLYIRNKQVKKLIKDIFNLINSGRPDTVIQEFIDNNLIIDHKTIALDLSRINKRLKQTNENIIVESAKMRTDYTAIQRILDRFNGIVFSMMNDNEIIEDKHTKLTWENKKTLIAVDDDYDTIRDRKKPTLKKPKGSKLNARVK